LFLASSFDDDDDDDDVFYLFVQKQKLNQRYKLTWYLTLVIKEAHVMMLLSCP